MTVEQQFRELNIVGADDAATHDRRMKNPDCQYILEDEFRARVRKIQSVPGALRVS